MLSKHNTQDRRLLDNGTEIQAGSGYVDQPYCRRADLLHLNLLAGTAQLFVAADG